jgi:hypothetical protein
MEQGRRANPCRLALKRKAVGQLRLLEVLDALEMAVDERRVGERRVGERRVGERPQMLGGLQFRRIWRHEEQVEMIWHV